MSTSRKILAILDSHTKAYLERFSFYLDAVDEVFHLQGQMGLDESGMQSLPLDDQNAFKAYLFLVESANTTWAAALRLLSSGFIADAYSLIRILYEVAALLHYGNSCPPETRQELHRSMFSSGLPEDEHKREEWKLIKRAETLIEGENPGLVAIRRELNNFGSHISRAKIVLGNVTALGESSASRVFTPNWTDNRYLAGLDFLFTVTAMILEEYAKLNEAHGAISEQVHDQVRGLSRNFVSTIRPRLQQMIAEEGQAPSIRS